jgi:hypothetical protein
MSPQPPSALRRAVDRVERALGPPLESATNAPEFYSVLVTARRVQRAVGSRADRLASWALHQAGLPSRRDIRGLRRQIAAVQQEVGALRRELADRDQHEEEKR